MCIRVNSELEIVSKNVVAISVQGMIMIVFKDGGHQILAAKLHPLYVSHKHPSQTKKSNRFFLRMQGQTYMMAIPKLPQHLLQIRIVSTCSWRKSCKHSFI
mmetsp:Transcript_13693/g.31574  ORF Transcript_13693/g.31574 Transcript_13693/m.31574 type:complete len:101 (-) Transcript_13693:711-1013(-)